MKKNALVPISSSQTTLLGLCVCNFVGCPSLRSIGPTRAHTLPFYLNAPSTLQSLGSCGLSVPDSHMQALGAIFMPTPHLVSSTFSSRTCTPSPQSRQQPPVIQNLDPRMKKNALVPISSSQTTLLGLCVCNFVGCPSLRSIGPTRAHTLPFYLNAPSTLQSLDAIFMPIPHKQFPVCFVSVSDHKNRYL